ncbi:MAG: hypothetical protein U1F65_12100 [Verrucomicrobiota bacterium]
MKNPRSICGFAVLLNFAVQVFFFSHRTGFRQLLSVGSLFAIGVLMLVSFAISANSSPPKKKHAFIAALICLVGLPAGFIGGVVIGASIQNARFQGNLPRYTEVVRLIERGELAPVPPDTSVKLPARYSDLASFVLLKTNTDGIVIEFMTDGGFPAKHSGYLYAASGNLERDTEPAYDWAFHSRINTNWFHIGN